MSKSTYYPSNYIFPYINILNNLMGRPLDNEVLNKPKKITNEIICEYILIKRKQSNLSRSKRDYIVFRVEKAKKKGEITQENFDLITKQI